MKILFLILLCLSFQAFAQENTFELRWLNASFNNDVYTSVTYDTKSPEDKKVLSNTLFKSPVGDKILLFKDTIKRASIQSLIKEMNEHTGAKAVISFEVDTFGPLSGNKTSLRVMLTKDQYHWSASDKFNYMRILLLEKMDITNLTPDEFEKAMLDFLQNELNAMRDRQIELIEAANKLKDFSFNCDF